ncbi:MAG: hypothetical protein ABI411_12050 [Tahibacter sp.]
MHRSRLVWLAVLSIVAIGAVGAENSPAIPAGGASNVTLAFASLNNLRRRAENAPGPLAALGVYRDAWQQSDGQLRFFIAQAIATADSELGLYQEALTDHPSAAPQTRGTPSAYPDGDNYVCEPAAAAIAELARDRRLVVVNEAHHVGESRWLSLELLPQLRALGYTHFAAESLDPRDRKLAARGYPVHASGYYVREPLYGEMVRRALQLGFQVVAYESDRRDASPEQREADQTDNLYNAVFAHNPAARLFVHAGYAHAHKKTGYLWNIKPMAQQLGERIGSAALSIDQSVLRPAAPGHQYGAYPLLVDEYTPRVPSVLRERKTRQLWSLEPDYYDVSVILPQGRLEQGRPDWLNLDGARTASVIPSGLCAGALPCLIEARRAGEPTIAIPSDRWTQRSGPLRALLYLPPGDYRLRASNANGALLGERDLQVSFAHPDTTD